MEVEFILYVSDQKKSRLFYEKILSIKPTLNVPGMTEFTLSPACKLGLMPENGIAKIITPALKHPSKANRAPRCELYFKVKNIQSMYKKVQKWKLHIVSEPKQRDWGDVVFYISDPDGHVVAIAQ